MLPTNIWPVIHPNISVKPVIYFTYLKSLRGTSWKIQCTTRKPSKPLRIRIIEAENCICLDYFRSCDVVVLVTHAGAVGQLCLGTHNQGFRRQGEASRIMQYLALLQWYIFLFQVVRCSRYNYIVISLALRFKAIQSIYVSQGSNIVQNCKQLL